MLIWGHCRKAFGQGAIHLLVNPHSKPPLRLAFTTTGYFVHVRNPATFFIMNLYCPVLSSQASLDEPTRTVVMHRTEPSHLQSLALQLAEKFSTLVDHNERIMEIRQGTFFSYQKKNQQGGKFVLKHIDRAFCFFSLSLMLLLTP